MFWLWLKKLNVLNVPIIATLFWPSFSVWKSVRRCARVLWWWWMVSSNVSDQASIWKISLVRATLSWRKWHQEKTNSRYSKTFHYLPIKWNPEMPNFWRHWSVFLDSSAGSQLDTIHHLNFQRMHPERSTHRPRPVPDRSSQYHTGSGTHALLQSTHELKRFNQATVWRFRRSLDKWSELSSSCLSKTIRSVRRHWSRFSSTLLERKLLRRKSLRSVVGALAARPPVVVSAVIKKINDQDIDFISWQYVSYDVSFCANVFLWSVTSIDKLLILWSVTSLYGDDVMICLLLF